MKRFGVVFLIGCMLFASMLFCALSEERALVIPEQMMIGDEAFADDVSITSLVIPSGAVISDSAFSGCISLNTLIIMGDASVSYEKAFSDCRIQTVYCPDDSEAERYFSGQKVNVYPVSDYFAGEVFEIEVVNARAVITGYKGTDVHVMIPPVVRGVPVYAVGDGAFSGNKAILSVTISPGVREIGAYAFDNCVSLERVDAPDSLRSIGSYAFKNNRNLKSVSLSEALCLVGENPFLYCASLREVSGLEENARYFITDGMIIDREDKSVVSYLIRRQEKSAAVPQGVLSIGKYAFGYAQNLAEVSLPESCHTISDCAFFESPSLKTVVFGENTHTIGASAFENCERLTDAALPETLKKVGDRAFKNCPSLSVRTLPDGVESVGKDVFFLNAPVDGNVLHIMPLYQFHYTKTICVFDNEEKSVSTSGCGATCVSMVIRFMNGDYEQTPETIFEWAYKRGLYKGDGLSHLALTRALTFYGVNSRWSTSANEALNCLKAGRPVIAHMGPGTFADVGHYILLRGVDENGMILVNDPNSRELTGQVFSIDMIKKQLRTVDGFCLITP